MRLVRLASETDFAGWREAARSLRAAEVAPEAVIWTVDGEGDLFAEGLQSSPVEASAFRVPRAFLELAQEAILHRSDERFALMYRVLWRLTREPNLMRMSSDPDVARLRDFAKAVDRAAHKMKAFVRFREVKGAEGAIPPLDKTLAMRIIVG